MRFALLATSSLIALALASYACSSSDDKATTTPDAGKTTGTSSSSGSKGDDDDVTSSSGNTSSGNSSSGSSSGASSSGDSGTSSSGSTSGSTTSSSGSPVDGGDTAGTKCLTGDQLETAADNGTQANAQVLTATTGTATTSFCGRITAGDTDFWTYTFTVDGTFSYSSNASFSATAPTITIITGGEEFPFNAVPSGKIKSGQAVVFKITGATAVDYHVSFNVTKT